MKLLFNDGDQHIGGHGAPDWRLHRVLAGAQEMLDAQILLDAFEERLHLPAALLQRRNGQRWQWRMIKKKHQHHARLGILESDAPKMLAIVLGHVKTAEMNGLIANHSQGSAGLARVHAPGAHAAFRSDHKERSRLMQLEESAGKSVV